MNKPAATPTTDTPPGHMPRYRHIRRYLYDIDIIGMAKEAEALRWDPCDEGNEYATRGREPCTQDNDAADLLDGLCRQVDRVIAEIARLDKAASRAPETAA